MTSCGPCPLIDGPCSATPTVRQERARRPHASRGDAGGKHGVRTNVVSPGVILTGAALATTTEEWRQEVLSTVRAPRLGVPEDLAATVAFLMSDDGIYVNGQSILVDGGADFT